jgi:hypothetical protein
MRKSGDNLFNLKLQWGTGDIYSSQKLCKNSSLTKNIKKLMKLAEADYFNQVSWFEVSVKIAQVGFM